MKRHVVIKYQVEESVDDLISLARMLDDHFKIVRTDIHGGYVIYVLVDNWFWLRKIVTKLREWILNIRKSIRGECPKCNGLIKTSCFMHGDYCDSCSSDCPACERFKNKGL